MDKIVLSIKDTEFLLDWRDKNKDFVRRYPPVLPACKIDCTESGYVIKGFRNESKIRLYVSHKGVSLGMMEYRIRPDGLLELVKDRTELKSDDKQSVLTVYCSAMAFMAYCKETVPEALEGNERENSETHSIRKNVQKNRSKKKESSASTVYLMKNSSGKRHFAASGYRKSPSGQFTVRGHFRHYKSGKVIWIDSFIKGSGKGKDKIYKIGNRI